MSSRRRALVFALCASGCAVVEERTYDCNAAPGCEEVAVDELGSTAPLFGPPSGRAASYPIVLAHGFSASPSVGGFNGVPEALQRDGHWVRAAAVQPYASVAVRAATLAGELDSARREFCRERHPSENPNRCAERTRVNVIAHSMGGIDSRHVISALGYGDRVASLTTVSTPHQGSAVADLVLGFLPDSSMSTVDRVLNALVSVVGSVTSRKDLARDGNLRDALLALAEASAADFNADHPDDPRVYYQSWAGLSRVGGGYRGDSSLASALEACRCTTPLGGEVIAGGGRRADFLTTTLAPLSVVTGHGREFRPNDGMVTVASARWGNFRGCVPADHLDETGGLGATPQGPNRWTGFDHVRFYRTVTFDLAARGF